MQQYTFQTPWGPSVNGFARNGKNDYNTLASILKEDEYNLKSILGSGVQPNAAIDLGSHIGGFTLACRSLKIPVVSVECLPENVSVQKRSLAANGWEGTVILHAAISNVTGEKCTVSYADTSTVNGDHHEFVGGSVSHAGGRSIEVDTINLKSIMDDHLRGVSGVIVKTDCEGAEWKAFKDQPDVVLDRIDWIVGEVHPVPGAPGAGSKADLIKLLRNKFEDVSDNFSTFNGAGDLCTFVFKRKGL